MNPDFDPGRKPGVVDEGAGRLASLAPVGLMLFVAAVLLPLTIVQFSMIDAVIRPFALAFGKPATAVISSKRVSHSRRGGSYVELNYQYSPDYAPRPEVKVNGAAYEALLQYSRVPIHYIPGCSSCVALDEDYGSARSQGFIGLAYLGFIILSIFARFFTRRR